MKRPRPRLLTAPPASATHRHRMALAARLRTLSRPEYKGMVRTLRPQAIRVALEEVPMPKINPAMYATGLAAYQAGENLVTMVGRANVLTDPGPAHTDDEVAVPSLFVGFLDGVLADIRKLVAAPPAQ